MFYVNLGIQIQDHVKPLHVNRIFDAAGFQILCDSRKEIRELVILRFIDSFYQNKSLTLIKPHELGCKSRERFRNLKDQKIDCYRDIILSRRGHHGREFFLSFYESRGMPAVSPALCCTNFYIKFSSAEHDGRMKLPKVADVSFIA